MSYNYNSGSCVGAGMYGNTERRCEPPLAIATVPMQKWKMIYSPEKALKAGTMFAELNLPFVGGKCK